MPYYHFAIIHDGQRITDPQGTILPDESAALRFARQIIGELARGDPDQYAGWFLELPRKDAESLASPSTPARLKTKRKRGSELTTHDLLVTLNQGVHYSCVHRLRPHLAP